MQYISRYISQLGKILISANSYALTGLWFEGAKYYANNLKNDYTEQETDVIKETKHWLDIYFEGKHPNFMPEINFIGNEFKISVWEILKQIPYGTTTTYNNIAKQIAIKKGIKKMSAQAIGGAVGHNPISIIIPCHRVIGTNGLLTGYAAGLHIKKKLLQLEGITSFN